MNLADARNLLDGSWRKAVTVSRSGASWTGEVVGVMERPSLILEREDGTRVVIALEGATAEEKA